MNYEKYPWLRCVGVGNSCEEDSALKREAQAYIKAARDRYLSTGAVVFPSFLSQSALSSVLTDCTAKEDAAFTTDDVHTPHQLQVDASFYPPHSVRNFQMRTQVASIAYDELPTSSELVKLYQHPTLLALVSAITGHDGEDGKLYLSEDPLGACSINVFRPNYAHSFHFDESEFSTTIMIREASVDGSGLFQYTPPLREDGHDLSSVSLEKVGGAIRTYCANEKGYENLTFPEGNECETCPPLHTLDFKPGTLSIFSGSRSLHRVTKVKGDCSRLTAVLTFATCPGFRNSAEVQKMFWGRDRCNNTT